MPQYFFQRQHINAALIHKRGGGMAQLMRGKSAAAQTRTLQAAGYDLLDPARRKPLASAVGDKQCILVHKIRQGSAVLPVALQGVQTGIVQIDEPFFITLAGYPDGVIAEITHIDRD